MKFKIWYLFNDSFELLRLRVLLALLHERRNKTAFIWLSEQVATEFCSDHVESKPK